MGLWRIDGRGRFRHRKGDGPRPALCYHGGAAFIVPVFQSYEFLDLTPTPIDIELEGALSQEANIIVPAEIEKRRIETLAQVDPERVRRLKRGEADQNEGQESRYEVRLLFPPPDRTARKGFVRTVTLSPGLQCSETRRPVAAVTANSARTPTRSPCHRRT